MLDRSRVCTPGQYRWTLHEEYAADVNRLIGADKVLKARLLALMRRAERGEAGEGEYKFPLGMTQNHPIGEMPMDDGGDKYRIYHAEPREDPCMLLGLVFAVKHHDDGGTWKIVQNGHIATARDRYIAWIARDVV